MSISESRHTFNYLDRLLSSERVASLDNFFLELDVATHMVEGKVKHLAARVGYHTLRGIAMGVQMAVFAVFMAIKYTALALYYGAKFCGRAVVALFVTTPIAIFKILFPTAADLHEKRVKISKQALADGTFSVEHIIGKKGDKHSQGEQKALMRTLLIEPILKLPECKSEWKECCLLMSELADGTLNPEELDEKEKKVKELKVPIKHAETLKTKFIEAFKSEREFESKLTVEEIREDPQLLLYHPRLLMRQDLEEIIQTATKPIQKLLLHNKTAILQHVYKQHHEKEIQHLEKLSALLQNIELEGINERYLSNQEGQFLAKRLEVVNERLNQLENQKITHGFEYFSLKFEKKYLQEQVENLGATTECVMFLERNGSLVPEINKIHDRSRASLCQILETRIQANQESLKLPKGSLHEELEASKKLATSKERLHSLNAMLIKLHDLEMRRLKEGHGSNIELIQIQHSLIEYDKMQNGLTLAHQVEEWEAFLTLTTPKQREEERQNKLAKDVLCMLLETKEECQIPLLLAKQDTRSLIDPHSNNDITIAERKGVYKKIEEASKAFVDAMSDKYLETVKKHLLSITEFTTQVQQGEEFSVINENGALKKKEKKEVLDFKTVGLTLQVSDNLSKWYAELQQIWIKHMPREQEEMLLAITNTRAQKLKMAEAFDQWFEQTTGKKLGVRLSFEHLSPPNHATERKEALDTLKSHFNKKPAGVSQSSKKGKNGFSPALLTNEKTTSRFTQVQIPHGNVDIVNIESQSFEDIIAGLERVKADLPPLTATNQLEWHTEWVMALNEYASSRNCTSLRSMILAECKEIISKSFYLKQPVADEVIEIFLQLYSEGQGSDRKFNFEKMYNFERGQFLIYFLLLSFSSRGTVTLSEEQSVRLKQLCSHSTLHQSVIEEILSCTQVVDNPQESPFSDQLMQVSHQLQASPIALEGVDAEIVWQSFQETKLPASQKTRTLLDSQMSRGTDKLSLHLLKYVYELHGKNLNHHQAREAIARALMHAHSIYPEQTREYILNKIQENAAQKTVVDQQTLAPPLSVFYCDLLRELDPVAYFSTPAISDKTVEFNLTLQTVAEAHHLLMGFARSVTELSNLIKYKAIKNEAQDPQIIMDLLRYKIAYQNLKKNHFAGKIEITGFLKVETDLAESNMILIDDFVQKYFSNPANEDAIKNSLKAWIASSSTWVEQGIYKELGGIKGEPQFKATQIKGFFTLNPGVVLDTTTGIVYIDGQQKIQLPPHLQNHPATRVLGIHHFPYIWDPQLQSFVYYIENENGTSEPHLLVKNIEQKPVIYKKLATSFKSPSTSYVQFVSKEDIQLPIAAMHRLKIQHFWQDGHNLFGYDNEGKLVAIFDHTSVTTEAGTYSFLTEAQKNQVEQIPHLLLLAKNFDLNEWLVDSTLTRFYIPALELKIEKRIGPSKQEIWIATFEDGIEKILMEPTSGSSMPVMKNKADPKKMQAVKRGLKEARYRRDLAKKESASLTEKHKLLKLEQAVIEQKIKWLELEEPQFMTTSFDEAYQVKDVKNIIKMLPRDWGIRRDFRDSLEKRDYTPHEVFPLMLKYLREVIDAKNQIGSSQKEIAPLLSAYLEIQKRYESVCDKSLEAVFFDRSYDASALTKDITGSLTLVINQLDEENPNYPFLIKELSKYPLQGSMTDSQVALVNKALEKGRPKEVLEKEKADKAEKSRILHYPNVALLEFMSYLRFMRYHHFLYKMRELAVMPLADQQKNVQEIKDAHKMSLRACEKAIEKLNNIEVPLSGQLLTLWRKIGVQPDHVLLKQKSPTQSKIEKTLKSAVVTELQVLGSKNLLERLSATEMVQAKPKSFQKELSSHQKELVNTFQNASQPQVFGFYFEKMGYFSLRELYAEFKVNDQGSALYGLRKEDVDAIFKFLQEQKLITAVEGTSNLYRLSSAEASGKLFPSNKFRASLATRAINEQGLQKTQERLQAFLFRAMQSGFDFSIEKGKETELDKKLNQEKEIHLQKYLEAEAILKQELPKYHATLVDLKYAYLTGDYAKFLSPADDNHKEIARLTNALSRYLFHKTEVQHIENIQKAPAKGERNKIQLLQTKRNYSTDLLLQESLSGSKRIEQIMQRAYLVFEEDYGNRCNLMQIRMFRSLMLGNTSIEGIDAIQARMGFGKTALLILLAVVRVAKERTLDVEERHLVRYVVPRAVLEDNTSFFNKRFSSILGRNVVQDKEFSRYQIDKEAPRTSFELIIIDLKARLHFYEEIRKQGNMVIQPPEIRCSMEAQDADFAEMLRENKFDRETRDLCLEAKRLLVQIRSIPTYNVFDELDDTQDFKSREVNFTRGKKIPIPVTNIRPLEQLITYIEQNKNKDWSAKGARAEEMVLALCTTRAGKKIQQCPKGLIDYLTNPAQAINNETIAFLSPALAQALNDPQAEQTENDALFFLIRMVLQDEYILSLIRSKQPSTHYGIRFAIDPATRDRRYSYDPDSRSALLISVPYEGVNTPKGLSVFDNREVAAITTLRYYLSNETSFDIHPHLDFLIEQIKKDELPTELAHHYLPSAKMTEHPIILSLRKMARMLDVSELKKAKAEFHQKYMQAPTKEFRKFFGMAVLATQIRSDEGCSKSDRYEQGSANDISLGCSGTVGDTSSYFTKQAPDPAADGMLSLEIMGRDNNSTIEWLEAPAPTDEYLPAIIKTLLDHTKPHTRAIADIAGICKSRDGTPETVIEELWRQLKTREQFSGVEGIIYYGKDNVKRLYRGHGDPILCTTEMEVAALHEGKKYFSFYKQKNCRGSDIKQAHGAHCLVTMDENVSNSDAKQTILRFRNIVTQDSGQTFSFAAMPEYHQIVLEELKSEKRVALDLERHKLRALIDEIKQTEKGVFTYPKDANLRSKLQTLKNERVSLTTRVRALRESLHKTAQLKLQAKDIAYYLRIQEKNAEEQNALTLFRKEMKAHIKVAAGHLEADLLAKLPSDLTEDQKNAYIAFLELRNKLTPFVERSLNSLYEKYGASTQGMDRDEFIEKQKRQALIALNALFDAARVFCAIHRVELSVNQKIYNKRIETSIDSFKQRFPKDKRVEISGTQSDGQNQAQAQAQAQAMAEAEACTETITETLLETQERLWTPVVHMSKKRREKVDFAFLNNDQLLARINHFPALENSIKTSEREKFWLSPRLKMKNEISHFALIDNAASKCILISQDEAEAFKREKESAFVKGTLQNSALNGYRLIDMRNYEQSVEATPTHTLTPLNEMTKQLPCVALGNNGIPEDLSKLTPADLRQLPITNVESRDLMPKLGVSHTDPSTTGFIQPKEFGLSKEMDLAISLDSLQTKDELSIKVAGSPKPVTVTLPLNNKPLNRIMKEVYQDAHIQRKIEEVHRRIDEEIKRLFPQLNDLRKKQAELDRLTKQNQLEIAKVKNFELSQDMKNGLLERDAEKFNDNNLIQKRIGKDAIQMCEKICLLKQEVTNNFSMQTLKELQIAFDEFVSPKMLKLAHDKGAAYLIDPLFDRHEWGNMLDKLQDASDRNEKCKEVSILERIYGRIVHSVHTSLVSDGVNYGAAHCGRLDCKNMFIEVIPSLIKVIPQLQSAVKAIEQNELEKQKIEKEIQKKLGEAKPWLDALVCTEKLLKAQTKIEARLNNQGLHYSNGEFFDQFQFNNLEKTPQTKSTITLQGTLPEYRFVVNEDMQSYKKTFLGLTAAELLMHTKSQEFLKRILELSKQIANRESEVHVQ